MKEARARPYTLGESIGKRQSEHVSLDTRAWILISAGAKHSERKVDADRGDTETAEGDSISTRTGPEVNYSRAGRQPHYERFEPRICESSVSSFFEVARRNGIVSRARRSSLVCHSCRLPDSLLACEDRKSTRGWRQVAHPPASSSSNAGLVQ